VTSQPGKTLAARTGDIQHKPMGFLALWKAWSVEFTCSLTVQFLPSTAQEHRFFATPNPPEQEKTKKNKKKNHLDVRLCQKPLNSVLESFPFYNIIIVYIGLLHYLTERFLHMMGL